MTNRIIVTSQHNSYITSHLRAGLRKMTFDVATLVFLFAAVIYILIVFGSPEKLVDKISGRIPHTQQPRNADIRFIVYLGDGSEGLEDIGITADLKSYSPYGRPTFSPQRCGWVSIPATKPITVSVRDKKTGYAYGEVIAWPGCGVRCVLGSRPTDTPAVQLLTPEEALKSGDFR
jgi:hypothetical protein